MKLTFAFAALLFSSAVYSGPAGVIPYACIEDGAYMLMAFDPHPNRKAYAAFGGSAESGESPADTAAREFREETRCAFDHPDASTLAAMTPSVDHGYAAYVAEIPFISPLEIPDHACEASVERSGWLWVRWADLSKALAGDEAEPIVVASLAHRYIRIWDKTATSMRAAMDDGLLPQKGLCPAEL